MRWELVQVSFAREVGGGQRTVGATGSLHEVTLEKGG